MQQVDARVSLATSSKTWNTGPSSRQQYSETLHRTGKDHTGRSADIPAAIPEGYAHSTSPALVHHANRYVRYVAEQATGNHALLHQAPQLIYSILIHPG